MGRRLLLSKAFYLLYFGAGASLAPFLALHYREAGLSGRQIGLLLALPPLIVLFAAPLWGAAADATRRRRLLLSMAIVGVLLGTAGISRARTMAWLLPAVAFYASSNAPISAFADSATLQLLGARHDLYARQRLWGAVGWGASAAAIGALTQRYGLRWSFYGYWPLMGGCLLLAQRFGQGEVEQRVPFWQGLRLLVGDRRWIAFAGTLFVAGVGASTAFGFLFLHLDDLGAPRTLMGAALTTASVGEVIMFATAGALMRRWGARRLLLGSLLAAAVRLLGYSLLRSPWPVLPLQLLHGPAFSGMWAAGVALADEMAPPGMRATAQALFGAVHMGLASAVGGFVGGHVYEQWGSAAVFRWASLVVVLAVGLFAVAGAAGGTRYSGAARGVPPPADRP